MALATKVTSSLINTVANTQITGVITTSQLANTTVSAGTYGGSSNAVSIVIDSTGRITSASNTSITTLPTQTGNTGKYLTTDGNTAFWSTVGNAITTPSLSPSATVGGPGSVISVTITNYNAGYSYIVAVDSGSYTRSANVISWTLPSVGSNTFCNMTVQAGYSGQVSFAATQTVSANVSQNYVDTTITLSSNFGAYSINNGWTF